MATKASLLSLLPCLLLATLASATLEEACKKAAVDFPDVDYKFCFSSLKAALGGGTTTNNSGLAVTVANLILAKANSTLDRINGLMKSATGEKKGPLQKCQEVYNAAITQLKAAAAAAGQGKYDDANKEFATGEDSTVNCEYAFEQMNAKSPLYNDNYELYQLSCIGESITSTGTN